MRHADCRTKVEGVSSSSQQNPVTFRLSFPQLALSKWLTTPIYKYNLLWNINWIAIRYLSWRCLSGIQAPNSSTLPSPCSKQMILLMTTAVEGTPCLVCRLAILTSSVLSRPISHQLYSAKEDSQEQRETSIGSLSLALHSLWLVAIQLLLWPRTLYSGTLLLQGQSFSSEHLLRLHLYLG
jgi:hypothetical protein